MIFLLSISGLHESFLQMVTIISGARSAATWYGFGRQVSLIFFKIKKKKGKIERIIIFIIIIAISDFDT